MYKERWEGDSFGWVFSCLLCKCALYTSPGSCIRAQLCGLWTFASGPAPPTHWCPDNWFLISHGVCVCACVCVCESKTLSPRSYLIAKNNVLVNCFINYLSWGASSWNKCYNVLWSGGQGGLARKEGEKEALESLINNIFIGQRKLSPFMKCLDSVLHTKRASSCGLLGGPPQPPCCSIPESGD